MPNGGPDNCGTCGYNRRNWGIWRNPQPDENEPSYCRIRSVPLTADHWTYCQNWHTRTSEPIGPVYASGLYENGYRRIPWHGTIEPDHIKAGVCNECRERFDEGLAIAVPDAPPVQFCSNLHYLKWWKRQHPGENAPMSENIWEH